MPVRFNLDEQKIVGLYKEEKLSAREIAKRFDVDHKVITKRIKEHKIPIEKYRNVAWNKGLTKRDPRLKNLVQARKKQSIHPNSKKHWFKKGYIPWHKGRTGVYSEKVRYQMGSSFRGKHISEKRKKDLKMSSKKLWEDPIYRKKIKKKLHMRPNYPEKRLLKILEEHFSGWKYTGDLSFFIGRKNPDFTNKSIKRTIDIFGKYWHDDEEEASRINYFNNKGWSALVIWSNEMRNGRYFDDEKIKRRIEQWLKY